MGVLELLLNNDEKNERLYIDSNNRVHKIIASTAGWLVEYYNGSSRWDFVEDSEMNNLNRAIKLIEEEFGYIMPITEEEYMNLINETNIGEAQQNAGDE